MQHDMYNHLICVNQKQKAIALCIFKIETYQSKQMDSILGSYTLIQ